MKHNPRCPFCGAPTRAEPFRERTAYQCSECASLCVGPEVASELLLAMAATPAGAPARRKAPARNMPLLTVGMAVVFLLLAIPVAFGVYRGVRSGSSEPGRPADPPVVLTLPPARLVPTPVPVVAPEAPVAAEEPGAVPPGSEVAPAPPPEAAPPPHPPGAESAPAPAPKSAAQAIALGWKRLDTNASAAATAFRQALELAPGNAEAAYGLGYALLQQGDRAEGARYLCTSRSGASAEMRREVESLLTHNDLKCP